MRNAIAALLCAVACSCTPVPALARPACGIVTDESMIAKDVADVQGGNIPGAVLQGVQAAAFAMDAEIADPDEYKMIAVFLLPGDTLIIVSRATAPGAPAIVCIDTPTDPGILAAIRKHFGVGA